LLVATDFGQRANTFPSGHTATAIAVALALVVLSPPALRGFVAILAGSYSWIVAADVQTVGWHRPSDAIGASLLAFATIALAAALLARSRRIGTGNRYGDLAAFPLLGLVWLISAATSALSASRSLAILVTTADSARPRGALLNDAYEFSVNLTVAVVVSLLIVLLLLLGKNDLDQPVRPS
jgi:hypothetical protein